MFPSEAMSREHGAWMDACNEAKKLGIDVNDPRADMLVKAFRKWGEELHALRAEQEPEVIARVLAEYREAYPGQFERGTYPESS